MSIDTDALTQENQRLREALMPFAKAASEFRPDDSDTMRPALVQALHFRNAAQVLGLPFTPSKSSR